MEIKDLEAELLSLRAEIERLKAEPKEVHHHYHYQQPSYQPYWNIYPLPYTVAGFGDATSGTLTTTSSTSEDPTWIKMDYSGHENDKVYIYSGRVQ